MFVKVLVLAVAIVAVTCEEHYRQKHVQREVPKEYRYRAHHQHIPLRAYHEAPASEEHYKVPESHGHTFSSQSIVHHGQAAAYEGSQEANTEHVAPVYQYVEENSEEHQAPVAHPETHKYHAVHYPAPVQHEIPAIQVPHHHAPSHYQPESHESPVYHQVPHNAPHHASHHEVPQPHHEIPIHHVPESHESHDELVDYYAYPKYQYEYKVEDPHTGDNKFQHEYRDGDVVKGIYGLQEADGSLRTVEYSSDKHNGFSAIVKHSAPGQHVHIESHHKN